MNKSILLTFTILIFVAAPELECYQMLPYLKANKISSSWNLNHVSKKYAGISKERLRKFFQFLKARKAQQHRNELGIVG